MDINNLTVTTTNGEPFSGEQSAQLAHLVWLRFGKDDNAACAAWNRLLQNNCRISDFRKLYQAHS